MGRRPSLFTRLKLMQQFNKQAKQKTSSQPKMTKNLDININNIRHMLGEPGDLVTRELLLSNIDKRAAIIYIAGITDVNMINDFILKRLPEKLKTPSGNILEQIYQEVIAITNTQKSSNMDDIALQLLNGNSIFLLDGTDTVLLMGTAGGENRSIEEPKSETLIRGPREGFVESLLTNMALIRKDIRDPNLRFIQYEIGKRSKQKIVLCYIEGLTNPNFVQEAQRRLETMDIDFISDSAYVEQWIEDSFLSPFPQIIDTERPDRVSYNLTQGKIAILVDGTPFALLAPITISDALYSIDDYNQRWISASFLRLLRYLAAFFSIFLPAIYIALSTFHPGMIPSTLTFTMAAAREGVPFPAAIEALFMAITFELLHEAGIRLPKVIGQTVGIVGGLVIGDAAVSAGIVSPIMVIVTALTAIASFSIPSYSVAVSFRMLRFALMLIAAIFGLYGIILGYIMINIHIVNLKSFGVPYSTPFAPTFLSDFKELVFRAPFTAITKRPSFLRPADNTMKNIKPEQKRT